MLKIVFRKCAGIDVHSTQITVCIAITDSNDIASYKTRIFPMFTENLKKCRDWLLSKDITNVCMETTGKYLISVYNILEEKINSIITCPKYVKTILAKKLTKKLLNGLLTCLNTVLLNHHLCRLKKFVNLEI